MIFNWFVSQSYDNNKLYCYDINMLSRLQMPNNNVKDILYNYIKNITESIIVIDNADVLLDERIREEIRFNSNKNTYILFGRNVSNLWAFDYNISNLVKDKVNHRFYLDYYLRFNNQ